jgi:RNA recognition motif-containing protein
MGSTVYVANLSWSTTTDGLAAFFAPAGHVEHVELFRDSIGRSKGCAVVRFASPVEATEAIEQFHDQELDGRCITVRHDEQADKFRSGVTVVVSGLPETAKWQDLKDTMRPAGDILHTDVQSDGVGKVRFSDLQCATNAVEMFDGSTMSGSVISVKLE